MGQSVPRPDGTVTKKRPWRPPAPTLVGESWREMWLPRVEANRLWIIDWLRNRTRDAYWKHGSVCEDYAGIEVPVYTMGGGGRLHQPGAATAREPERPLQGPHRSLGLPVHAPDRARPDDGFPDEALRWWDHRLRGKDARVTAEPAYRV